MSASELRQRHSPTFTPMSLQKKSTIAEEFKPNATERHSKAKATRAYIAITCLVVLLLYLRFFGSNRLPTSYILCSAPDTISIYTVDDRNPKVECLAVNGYEIIDTGTLVDLKHHHPTFNLIHIKPNETIVPGLTDSHVHALEHGAQLQLPLENTNNVHETVRRVAGYITSDPSLQANTSIFIEGWGWDHTKWPGARFPSSDAMERNPIVRGRPIVLQSKDGHALWVSAKILQEMMPLPDEVEGGAIIRDKDGKPTGVFIDNAQQLVPKVPPTEAQLLSRWAATVKDAHSFGITSIHDAGFSPVSLRFFERQAENNNLPLRVYGMRHFDENGPYWGNVSQKLIAAGKNARLTSRSVKLFADGALRSGGAALYEPYADNPETNGLMRISTELLNEIIPNFLRDGWQVNVHAVGDRAHGIVLDAFENALAGANVHELRPRLEHAQFMTQGQMSRLGKLGVIASVQPTHAISDMWFAEDRLGPERVKGLYAFRSILDEGARITFGSDCPVESMNPLWSFYAAITRASVEGKSPHGPGGWFPEQRITREEALRGITIGPAYASFTEGILGSLVPGKRADYVVLSRNIMEIPATEILDTKVIATVMDGKPVFGKL